MKISELGLTGCIDLITKLAQDYYIYSMTEDMELPCKLTYRVTASQEPRKVQRLARVAALQEFSKPQLIKVAFDTRRINQETERNPRENLQYWNRTDQFIDDETQDKINIFANLLKSLDELKQSFGTQPEWHGSYTRVLHDAVYRILRVKEADLDIFRPQIAYLEQLIFNRYRLSMEELSKISGDDFKNVILKKDENLLKRGAYLHSTKDSTSTGNVIVKNNDGGDLHQNIVNAIFGNNITHE